MREIGGGANEKDSVAVDEAGDGAEVDLVRGSWAGDEVDFDAEVGACFAECCVAGFWEYPGDMLVLIVRREGWDLYISGSVTPLSAYAFCLALKQAIKIDSVPPLVVTPAAPTGALNIASTMLTISASIFLTPGNTSG